MKTSYRDGVLEKNRLFIKLTLLWAVLTTVSLIVLSALCFYAFKHKEVHWLPICTGNEFSIGDSAYSASYLQDMTQKAADLRLTYNPSTIAKRFSTLSDLIEPSNQELFKRRLDRERKTVQEKNISSVFYSEKILVDVARHQGQIEGLLYRTSHGLQVEPKRKVYIFQFSFKQGLLSLQSVKEIHNAR